MLYNELDFLERFDAAAAAGFVPSNSCFRMLSRRGNPRSTRAQSPRAGAAQFSPGNWEGGERGIACHPDRVAEFQDSVGKAIEYAKALGAPQLNCLVGIPQKGATRDATQATLVANLKFAADKLKAEGLRLLIEPLNSFDIPGIFLTGRARRWRSSTRRAPTTLPAVRHLSHAADGRRARQHDREESLADRPHADGRYPGRNEPGTGEINYGYLFRAIDALGYDGWIGCEYKPATTTSAGLSWMDPYRQPSDGPAAVGTAARITLNSGLTS
jgi:hydroxypyruvate isomerase